MVYREDIIKKAVWIGFAIIMFSIGLFLYSNPSEGADETMVQISFHVLSGIPVAGYLIRFISNLTNIGRDAGSREYNVTRTSSNSFRITNNSGFGMFIGAFIGIILAIAVAPILLWIMVIYNVVRLIRMIIAYRNQ